MTQRYKLLPVQVENLRKQHDDSLLKLKSLNILKNEEFADNKVASGKELNLGLDTSLLGNLSIATKDYKEAKEKLGNYELIEPNNSEIIGLGSTFEISMNYGDFDDKETFTLVEVHNVCDDSSLISVVSPLGKAALGKKVGDNVSYIVEDRKFTGTINSIIIENKKTL